MSNNYIILKTKCMNTKKNLFALSLGMIIFSGCSQNVDMWGTGDYGGYTYYSSTIVFPLNPTETKLKGKWNLMSISTLDSFYTDKIFLKNRNIEFSDSGIAHRQLPRYFVNGTGVTLRKVPNNYPGPFYYGDYLSPDISDLKIIKGDLNSGMDSSLLKIMTLTATELSLRDTISNLQWNFVR